MQNSGGFGGAPVLKFLDGDGFDHASGLQTVADRHGVSLDAVRHLVQALERGGGTMAQFDHPELGGMGQWTAGGMTMVGRMFDDALRARVASLCGELAAVLPAEGFSSGQGRQQWWPDGLGFPSTTGSQNGLRYAYFPESRRLALEGAEGVVVYDTGEYAISGVSQSNGFVTFSGPFGPVPLDRLRRIGAEADSAAAPAPQFAPQAAAPFQAQAFEAPPAQTQTYAAPPAPAQPFYDAPPAPAAVTPSPDILTTIERLAELQARGVLTEGEFAAKKAELLARL